MNLPNKIYNCRKRLGHSQEKLAEEIGVSRQAISKWETGEATPEVGKVLALCKIFSVSADWILNDDADMDDLEVTEVPTETDAICEVAEPDTIENKDDTAEEVASQTDETEHCDTVETVASEEIPTEESTETADDIPTENTANNQGFKNLITFKIYRYFGRIGYVILGLIMAAIMVYGEYFRHKIYNSYYYSLYRTILSTYGMALFVLGMCGIVCCAFMLIYSFVYMKKLSSKERFDIAEQRRQRFKKYSKLATKKLGYVGGIFIIFLASIIMSMGILFSYEFNSVRSFIVSCGLIMIFAALLLVILSILIIYSTYKSNAIGNADKSSK